jgi:hypothetical protein
VKLWVLGKPLISLVAVAEIVGPFIADWNRTHIYNPRWPPHAKFHGGQTVLMGAALGGLSLGYLWLPRGDQKGHLQAATLLASLYWITQMGAFLVPGAAATDPDYEYKLPTIAGIRLTQFYLAAFNLLVLLAGYMLETKRRGTQTTSGSETS